MAVNDTAPQDFGQAMPVALPPALPLPKRLWRGLRSVRFAIVLMALIALACIVGTLIKQEPYDPARMVEHYGRSVGSLIGLLGLSNLYHTWWFVGLLGLFALSTTACSATRLRWRVRSIGFGVVHLSIVFIVAGAMVKGIVGVEGVVTIREGETVDAFKTDAGPMPLGFRLRLNDFQVKRHTEWVDRLLVRFKRQTKKGAEFAIGRVAAKVGGAFEIPSSGTTITVLRHVANFESRDGATAPAPGGPTGPAIEVHVQGQDIDTKGWLFMTRPGFLTEADLAGGTGAAGGPDAQRWANGDDVLLVRLNGERTPRIVPAEVGKPVKLRDDGTTIEVLRRLSHFVSTSERIYSASDRPANPAVEVRVSGPAGESKRWFFLKFPGFQGHGAKEPGLNLEYGWRPGLPSVPEMRFAREPGPVKSYESQVAILDDQGGALKEATVMVNGPMEAGRYTLYQLSYDPKTEASSTLEVVHDPGVPLVFIGFLLMPLGMAFVFYVQPLLKRRSRCDV